jgi:hypothetical protein
MTTKKHSKPSIKTQSKISESKSETTLSTLYKTNLEWSKN